MPDDYWGSVVSTTTLTRSPATYHIFLDESHTSASQGDFRVQGGIWVREPGLELVRAQLTQFRSQWPNPSELGWKMLRRSQIPPRAAAMVQMFFTPPTSGFMRFECIVVNHRDDPTYCQDTYTRDVGIYKTLHLLCRYRIELGSVNHITVDGRPRVREYAETQLKDCLNGTGRKASPPFVVATCVPGDSVTEDLIQLADLLCGAVGWEWNGCRGRTGAKQQLHAAICGALRRKTLRISTGRTETKFGIWPYRPKQRQVA